ncbi:MAG: hypothetical protein U0401_21985 [Anaerolineae bacterium]
MGTSVEVSSLIDGLLEAGQATPNTADSGGYNALISHLNALDGGTGYQAGWRASLADCGKAGK